MLTRRDPDRQAFLNRSTGFSTNELENLSRAQAIMTNINVLVNRNLEMADRSAENKEIQRLIVSDVSVWRKGGGQ